MNVVFTLCSNNYLARAAIVAHTYQQHHPADHFYIFLVDRMSDRINYLNYTTAQIIEIASVVPDIEQLALKYNIIELNTAVKPKVFQYLFHENPSVNNFVYLDPDLMIFSSFTEVYDLLANDENNMVLTPHFCSPIDDGKYPSEIDFNLYGLYNLGFAAIKRSDTSTAFLAWWHERLMKYCYIKPELGMFTDQLWANYAPLFFDGVVILKHPGYNIANWNLYERKVSILNEEFLVNEIYPLRFFHFSHFIFEDPYKISRFQNRYTMDERPDIKKLIDLYHQQLGKKEHHLLSTLECYYQTLYLKQKAETDKKAADEYYTFKRRTINFVSKVLNKVLPG